MEGGRQREGVSERSSDQRSCGKGWWCGGNAPLTSAPLTNAPLMNAPLANALLMHVPFANAPLTHTPLMHAPLMHAPLTNDLSRRRKQGGGNGYIGNLRLGVVDVTELNT